MIFFAIHLKASPFQKRKEENIYEGRKEEKENLIGSILLCLLVLLGMLGLRDADSLSNGIAPSSLNMWDKIRKVVEIIIVAFVPFCFILFAICVIFSLTLRCMGKLFTKSDRLK